MSFQCCPGYVDTDMTSHKGPKTIDEGTVNGKSDVLVWYNLSTNVIILEDCAVLNMCICISTYHLVNLFRILNKGKYNLFVIGF